MRTRYALRTAATVLALTACTGGVTRDESGARGVIPSNPNQPYGAVGSATALTLHRLNRTEYNNTIRDVLQSNLRPADSFPADVSANGFDNNADALTLSDDFVDLAALAAQELADEAVVPTSPGYARLVPCDPNGAGASSCLLQVIRDFGLRAWRRPLTDAEVTTIASLARQAGGQSFTQALNAALQYFLVSPAFLFRVEVDPNPGASAPRPLNDYDLASRLSYFLWASAPDDALLAAAAAGQLQDPTALDAQVTRMLADPKAVSLTSDFAGQWLGLRALAALQLSYEIFPNWNDAVHQAMQNETALFFQDFLASDAALSGLLTADFTYLNDTLAGWYGLPLPQSSTLVRTPLDPNVRKGLLTQGTFLTANSYPDRTSPVLRGKFILTQLLCAAPGAPPPGVPALPSSSGGTQRQQLEAHVTNATCAVCHNLIDPLGFAFENFDGASQPRTSDNGQPVDTTGTLPSGASFKDGLELATLLSQDKRLPACIAQQMLTYALGHNLTSSDEATLAGLTHMLNTQSVGLRTLIHQIVLSDSFRTIATTPASSTGSATP